MKECIDYMEFYNKTCKRINLNDNPEWADKYDMCNLLMDAYETDKSGIYLWNHLQEHGWTAFERSSDILFFMNSRAFKLMKWKAYILTHKDNTHSSVGQKNDAGKIIKYHYTETFLIVRCN